MGGRQRVAAEVAAAEGEMVDACTSTAGAAVREVAD